VLWLILATIAVAVGALAIYVRRERLGARGVALAALRTVAVASLLVLLANAGREETIAGGPATVLLDASLSMGGRGGHWATAVDTARRLAGERGAILAFGEGVRPFTGGDPGDGRSRVAGALRAAAGRGGPVFLVTDGELEDFLTVPVAMRRGVVVVLERRDTVPDAALRTVGIDRLVTSDDSIRLTADIGTWGALRDTSGVLEIRAGGRRLARRVVTLPPAPGQARRTVSLPPGTLAPGTHVVTISLTVAGDQEPSDDVRERVVTVSSLPGIVLVTRPPDWESRFLMRELDQVTRAPTRGYAEVAPGRWVDMRTLAPVAESAVRTAAAQAALVVSHGAGPLGDVGRARWRWPAGVPNDRAVAGDWYAGPAVPVSPLAGELGTVEWDSVPPIAAILPRAVPAGAWVALSTRLGRRGPTQPLLVGEDSAGVRMLMTTGSGLWRWALRGGAAREAFRAVLASGVDWLLGTPQSRAPSHLTASEVVARGTPLAFRWLGDSVPAPVPVDVTRGDSTWPDTLRFDATRTATLLLEPGVYHWRTSAVPGAAGTSVVETYSDEVPPGAVTVDAGGVWEGARRRIGAREVWWVFAVAVAALVAEWGWRMRRGLP
jgi:hypothetical protein